MNRRQVLPAIAALVAAPLAFAKGKISESWDCTPPDNLRQGIVVVSTDHPASFVSMDEFGAEEKIVNLLNLPPGTRITGISPHVRFMYDQMTYRIWHKDLPITAEGCLLRIYEPVWKNGRFVSWR